MANMGYCRFQNTVEDLRDCEESEGMYDPSVLSDEEKRSCAAESLPMLTMSEALDRICREAAAGGKP